MIEEYQYIYYISYALVCAVTAVTYIKVQSTESLTITTKEFKKFRDSFLAGYIASLFVELLSVASFYHVLTDLNLNLEQITDLYIATIVSTAIFGVLAEVVDFGSRKKKCVLTAVLFFVSLLTLLNGKNFELLLLGRVLYGAATVLLHSAFDSYIVHENASIGYPDDWLMQIFSLLAHSMAFASAASGGLGQALVGAGGSMACVGVAALISLAVAVYISLSWAADISGSRFMLNGFVQVCAQTVQAARSNSSMTNLMLLSCCYEACITIFTFYWAPWMAFGVKEESHEIPYELVFSVMATSSMLGNYVYGLLAPQWGHDSLFQTVLAVSASGFFLGAVFQTPSFILLISMAIQFCIGFYWPAIGFLRGRHTMPEFRTAVITLTR
jgi:MFS family permease